MSFISRKSSHSPSNTASSRSQGTGDTPRTHRAPSESKPNTPPGYSSRSSFESSSAPRRSTLNMMAAARPSPADGIRPKPAYAAAFQPHQVAPNVSVPTKIGVHWGPATAYSDVGRINAVADSLKERGVGFVTVIVNSENVEAQQASIKALLDRGIEPVIRLLPGSDYNKTMDQLSDAEMESMANAAKKLQDMGVKLIQLDNEPNHDEGGKQLFSKLEARYSPNATEAQKQEYEQAMNRYADNLAKTMSLIEQKAPGMAVGFAAFAPGRPHQEEMFNDLVWRMKSHNDASGGELLKNSWLATHPYSTGQEGDGVALAEHWRHTAEQVLGFPIKSLATEGGNAIRHDRATTEQPSSDINLAQMRAVANDPNATQNYWLIGDQVLTGSSEPGPWEMDSLVYLKEENGQLVQKESIFFQNMLKVTRGEIG
ncbi:MAG TPA: hypothetical protein VFZ09_47365 [Archangium sp.]|uniref:hypothetical protein n=1 Tax=Archangium sp. TaxID=1872627 RepID=UPI002E2F03C1|nr:hypothetical protein [Archangium sp.]HEX5753895.1 hypothetical protein [Archangium sp.]